MSNLPLQKQAKFREVSKDASAIGWSVLKPKFGNVFNSPEKLQEKLQLFFDDAKQFTGRLKQTLLALLEKLLNDSPDDDAFDQALRDAGVFPEGLTLTSTQRDWLKIPQNLLGILRWVSTQDMQRILDAEFSSPFVTQLENALIAVQSKGKSAELPLAMLKDDMGIDLGITKNCNYLHDVAEFGQASCKNDQQHLNLSLSIKIATILLEKGVNIETPKGIDGGTALHRASQAGYDQMVAFLISKGANLDAGNRKKQTPLYFATVNKHAEIIDRLLEAGADPNLFSSYRTTPRDIRSLPTEIIQQLEEAGGFCYKDLNTEEAKELSSRRYLFGALPKLDIYLGDNEDCIEIENNGVLLNQDVNNAITPLEAAVHDNLFALGYASIQWALGLLQRTHAFLRAAFQRFLAGFRFMPA